MLLPLVSLLLFWQSSLGVEILQLEDGRTVETPRLTVHLKDRDPRIRSAAVQALGRLERRGLAASVRPMLADPDPRVRSAAALAMIHLQAADGLAERLAVETDNSVRGQLLEALGRLGEGAEPILAGALERSPEERKGALRGLEARLRLRRPAQLAESTLATLSRISRHDPDAWNRRLAATTLLAVGNPRFIEAQQWWSDSDDQIRRLAARALAEFRDDPSYLVRYEGLRASSDCTAASRLTSDPSPHVRTLAVRLLAAGCAPERLLEAAGRQDDPLLAAQAVLSLAEVDPGQTRDRIPALRIHPHWRVRELAATAAVRLRDEELRRSFLEDSHPNVVAAVLTTPEEALAALGKDDYGLLVKALGLLEGWSSGDRAVPLLMKSWTRLSGHRRETSRDPRSLLLRRLAEFSPASLERLEPPVRTDFDPAVRRLAASLQGSSGTLESPPSPLLQLSASEARQALSLIGARARIRLVGGAEFTLDLLAEEAPVTVFRFVQRAGRGYYNGLTFHRIEPNFVIQGGSPGANEYVGAAEFTRDELSSRSHLRGTVGVSTRGRDTGDGQLFVNLVDNYRLDHNYTIFARVSQGIEEVDRIRETDLIASIEIIR